MSLIYGLNWMAHELYSDGEFDRYRYFLVHANVEGSNQYIDDVVYKGCPLDNCKKQVIPICNGRAWFCVKCNKVYWNFQYRYKLKVFLDDGTTRRPFMVTMFDNTAKPFLGISAPDLAEVHDKNHAKYDSYFNDAEDRNGHFRLKVALIRFGSGNNQRKWLNGIVNNFWFDSESTARCKKN